MAGPLAQLLVGGQPHHGVLVIEAGDQGGHHLRIGLAAGPVAAGVVGARRFFYDVWGDAVNVASRMQSTASAGRIQVPHDVYERLKNDFVFEERGDVDIKGKGVMHTWYLVGRAAAGASRRDSALGVQGSCDRSHLS